MAVPPGLSGESILRLSPGATELPQGGEPGTFLVWHGQSFPLIALIRMGSAIGFRPLP